MSHTPNPLLYFVLFVMYIFEIVYHAIPFERYNLRYEIYEPLPYRMI